MKYVNVEFKNVSPKNYHRVVPFNDPCNLGYGLYISSDDDTILYEFEIDGHLFTESHLMILRMTGVMPSLGNLTGKELTIPVLNDKDRSVILKPNKEEQLIYITVMNNSTVEIEAEYVYSTKVELNRYKPISFYDGIIIK